MIDPLITQARIVNECRAMLDRIEQRKLARQARSTPQHKGWDTRRNHND